MSDLNSPKNPTSDVPVTGFVADLYQKFLANPASVPAQWQEVFLRQMKQTASGASSGHIEENYGAAINAAVSAANTPASPQPAATSETEESEPLTENITNQSETPGLLTSSQVRSDLPPAPRVMAEEPTTAYARREFASAPGCEEDGDCDQVQRLKGVAAAVSRNMEASLAIPTATSLRQIAAKVMIDNRLVINNFLSSTSGGKVSFTHLIGYAMVEALTERPEMNVAYALDTDGKPSIVKHPHVNFGLAIDLPKDDGTRTLVVPCLKLADTLNFAQFVDAYEAIVKKARTNQLQLSDFQGSTCTLTNPGGLGTSSSTPRLMPGQGVIVGVGAMQYPAGFAGANLHTTARLGVSKVMTLTSTYDHRVIQGAESGEFLRLIERKLLGLDGFYDRIYTALRVPYPPFKWTQDIEYSPETEVDKPARIVELIQAYRSSGHLLADTDPIAFIRRTHPDLDLESYGLTLWDLDRSFPTGGFAGTKRLELREMLTRLRRAYCKHIGIEYMHIQDPQQRQWFQQRLEVGPQELTRDEQMRILQKLLEAEAFETFLHTKFVGQKRFSLEGGESLIPLLDTILNVAADSQVEEVVIGMAHRGRLNVLTNIAGKSYGQVFNEFEGNPDPESVQGSGDVKYHLGTEGTHLSPSGQKTQVYLAANPSHLEAVSGVVEGIARAAQDRRADAGIKDADSKVCPLIIHGDAALAGQGVVQETLNFSQLRGYRTGGTIHVVVNNQIGFTTGPASGRSSRYPTDIAKGLQVPIFHVNGDKPGEVARVAKLAIEYRQTFKKDVFIDLVCYRRRGHNEGDDPSMTQPVMYGLINGKDTTLALYTRSLLGRGIITEAEADGVKHAYQKVLEDAFAQLHSGWSPAANTDQIAGLELPRNQQRDAAHLFGHTSAVDPAVLQRIGQAHLRAPAAFALHPKLAALYEKRAEMSEGLVPIDWGFAETLAFGSLLMEGTPIRMSGEDCRRGTFVQRHWTTHDHNTGREWTPLQFLTADQAPLHIYDSPLSEYGVLGFEYGYSVESPQSLTIWEAQFGDFAIGAQTVIDEFICSAGQKWGQQSALTLLLPHGYEGQGPDHSSARIERFLALSAQENWRVAQPSTPANYFHLLREQAYRRPRTPLVVFTPKQLLRLKAATSEISELTHGKFEPVYAQNVADLAQVARVLVCSGRIYYDLLANLQKLPVEAQNRYRLVRLEQFYPLPAAALAEVLAQTPAASVAWVQDEPENQGPWPFICYQLWKHPQIGEGRRWDIVSRPAMTAPSSGWAGRHREENAAIMQQAFSL